MTTGDMLILIPVVPLFPVIATWFLPWEDWLPKKVPKLVLGPYLLYAAFAAWHFKASSFAVIMTTLGGVGLSVAAILERIPAYRDLVGPPVIFPRLSVPQTSEKTDEDVISKKTP